MPTRQTLLLLLTLATCLNGCQSITEVVHNPFSKVPEPRVNPPVSEIICVWEKAEGIGLDQQPTRGFAGQLMFFSVKQNEPVPVDGDVQIFVFDDLGTEAELAKPLHTFKFDKEAFHAFKTETNLGIAYQLFIPYVRKTEYQAHCSIRVRVGSELGQPLYSKMAAVILPGPESPQSIARRKASQAAIQLASDEAEVPRKPTEQASAETVSAYFGAASLPKGTPNLNADRDRLRSALSQVVQNNQANPVPSPPSSYRHPLDLTAEPASAAEKPAAPARHPLLDD